MFKRISLPVQLVLVIIGVLLFGSFVPLPVTKVLFTFSTIFKEFLSFILPFIIFSFVLSGILSLKAKVPLVLLTLLSTIFISNVFVATLVYGVMHFVVPHVSHTIDFAQILNSGNKLEPLLTFSLPTVVRSEIALVIAIVMGLIFSWFRSKTVETAVNTMKQVIESFLLYCFIPLLPLYVLGFLLKLKYEGMFATLIQQYGGAFLVIVAFQLSYLLLMYFLASGFSFARAKKAILNALPSYLTAFGTMSSTVTVPVSVECAVKNTKNRPLANVAMPIMANVHLLGDSISTPILALVTLSLFLNVFPPFYSYATFVLYFGTSMFAVSGIPGGGILVMIPVLQSILGFTPAMVSIITALYLLLDPFGTAANVMGDGALVMIVDKLLKKLGVIRK